MNNRNSNFYEMVDDLGRTMKKMEKFKEPTGYDNFEPTFHDVVMSGIEGRRLVLIHLLVIVDASYVNCAIEYNEPTIFDTLLLRPNMIEKCEKTNNLMLDSKNFKNVTTFQKGDGLSVVWSKYKNMMLVMERFDELIELARK
jgi:hypothetical protein